MLPVRAIFFGRVVSRLTLSSWPRYNSTRPPGSQEYNNQKKLEKSLAGKDAIPLTAPSPKLQEPLLPESPPTASSPSSPQSTLKFDAASDKPDSWKELSPYDLDLVKQRIRDWTDQAAITFRERADGFTAQTKTRFSQLGAELNRMTGYEEIEVLKKDVVEQGLCFVVL